MLKKLVLAAIGSLSIGSVNTALAHNGLDLKEAYAGYSTFLTLSVNHGCKGSPITGLRVKVPEGITDARAAFAPGWAIEYKMRDLETPITSHGREITQVVDEIMWTAEGEPLPANSWIPFKFKMTIPDKPGEVLHIQNITTCVEGTDPYIDLPETALDITDPDFAKKSWDFMIATDTPSPFLIIREPEKKQYPWDWTPEQVMGNFVAPDEEEDKASLKVEGEEEQASLGAAQ